jgi:hypothetical protein
MLNVSLDLIDAVSYMAGQICSANDHPEAR